jgi:hypothetical protein
MFGGLISIAGIAVDNFLPSAEVYFLSHVHSDHTAGLNSRFSHPIYCTEPTARLIVERFRLDNSMVVFTRVVRVLFRTLIALESASFPRKLLDCRGRCIHHSDSSTCKPLCRECNVSATARSGSVLNEI